MTQTGLTTRERRPTSDGMTRMIAIAALAAAGMTGGCVNVTAPDKPIVINLNINITQEVVYRLDGEAKTAIQQNPGIF
jgi:hypothetical protein